MKSFKFKRKNFLTVEIEGKKVTFSSSVIAENEVKFRKKFDEIRELDDKPLGSGEKMKRAKDIMKSILCDILGDQADEICSEEGLTYADLMDLYIFICDAVTEEAKNGVSS